MKVFICTSFRLLMLGALTALHLQAATLTFSDAEDAYITGSTILGHDSNNYGSATTLNIYNNSHLWGEGLFKFPDIMGPGSQQVPAGSTITGAEFHLWLRQSTGNASNTFMLFQLTRDWQENTVAATNYGRITQGVNAVFVPEDSLAGPTTIISNAAIEYTFDVSQSLTNWMNGNDNYGWGLKCTGPLNYFRSSEDTLTGQRPSLTVTYEPSSVPEPELLLPVTLGMFGCLLLRRRARIARR